MNLGQAREKLDSISKSTGTKHHKILIAELCSVVKFLLNEIERIQSPPVTLLSIQEDRLPTAEPFVSPPIELPPVRRSSPIEPPSTPLLDGDGFRKIPWTTSDDQTLREGDAGDAT